MTRLEPAPPVAAAPGTQPSVRTIVGDSLRLVLRQPRETMLPLAAIQVPVTFVMAIATAFLYLTVFKHEPVTTPDTLLPEGSRATVFAFLVLTAGQAMFAQVARAATIVSVAGVITGKPRKLSEALDPAFTRMGGLLVLIVILTAGVVLAAVSLVGLVVLPYVALRVALAFEVFMLEDLGPWAAIRRSWNLTRGHALRLLGLILVLALLVAGPLVAISSLGLLVGGGRTTQVLTGAVYTAVQGVLLIPLLAVLTTTTTRFYLTISSSDARRPARN